MKIITLSVGLLRTNCYIVYNEETLEALIIDPGDSSGRIISKVNELGLNITHIILTHSHFDHVMALASVQETCGGSICIHEYEAMYLEEPGVNVLLTLGLPRIHINPAHADITLHDGDILECIGEKFTVIHTPGHTVGSICLDNGEVLFTGDTLFQSGCGRCDLPGGSIDNMYLSLKKLSGIDGDRIVYPGHGPSTTLDTERRSNINMIHAEELQ